MIAFKRDIIKTILFGQVDETGDYVFESFNPRFSAESLLIIQNFDVNKQIPSFVFYLNYDKDTIIIEYLVYSNNREINKTLYLDTSLNLRKLE